jgi:hypothetical protein
MFMDLGFPGIAIFLTIIILAVVFFSAKKTFSWIGKRVSNFFDLRPKPARRVRSLKSREEFKGA